MAPLASSVAAFFDELSAVWKSNDGAAAAALFTEDGSLINPFGERADGRAALAAMYTDYFGGMLQGTTTSVDVARVRAIGSDLAVADAEQTVFAASGDVVLNLHVVNVLRRDGDDWRLLDSRPYAFSVPPQD